MTIDLKPKKKETYNLLNKDVVGLKPSKKKDACTLTWQGPNASGQS